MAISNDENTPALGVAYSQLQRFGMTDTRVPSAHSAQLSTDFLAHTVYSVPSEGTHTVGAQDYSEESTRASSG